MKITITKSDLKKAQKEYANGSFLSECCLIFQACKRKKIPVKFVCCSWIRTENNIAKSLDKEGQKITAASSKSWPRFVGKQFEIL